MPPLFGVPGLSIDAGLVAFWAQVALVGSWGSPGPNGCIGVVADQEVHAGKDPNLPPLAKRLAPKSPHGETVPAELLDPPMLVPYVMLPTTSP